MVTVHPVAADLAQVPAVFPADAGGPSSRRLASAPVKPFLLLSSRPEDAAAEDEYAAFLRLTGLTAERLRWIRTEAAPLPRLDLDQYSGVFLGGGPFNSSDPPAAKSSVQRRVEYELGMLLDEIVARDFPFLGACYGIATLGVHQGGIIDRTYAEPVGCIRISLTAAGLADRVLAGVPAEFDAFVGHKEACRVLPASAVLLASSALCPVQMFRVKQNLYATQFHPELDMTGVRTRVRVYQHAGYFPPDEAPALLARLGRAVVAEPARILANFVARYA
jgi:GMP synthase (glutamine-hydrolysing)